MIEHWKQCSATAQRLFMFRASLQRALDDLLVQMLGEGTENGFKTVGRENGTEVGLLLTFDKDVITGIGSSDSVKRPRKRASKLPRKEENNG